MAQGDVSFANSLRTRAYSSGPCEPWELEGHHRVRDEGQEEWGSTQGDMLLGDPKLKPFSGLLSVPPFFNESRRKSQWQHIG